MSLLFTSCEQTTNVIGDQGLEVLSSTCKKLKRLHIERGEDEQTLGVEPGVITQTGLIAIAQGCHKLEYLSVNVTDIGNEALECIGTHLKNLHDFRLVLCNRVEEVTDLPLDNGVQALLQGCKNIRRLSLYLRQGGLTDTGLSYIGQLGQNVRWMCLGCVGETDAGVLELSKGCPKLQTLEMRACCFTERALAIAATQLTSLRLLWVQGHRASQMGMFHLLEMARPYWNIELILEDKSGVGVDCPAHFVAYYSLAGQRTDHPATVYPLALPGL